MNAPVTLPVIANSAARRLFLGRHGLADPPAGRGADLAGIIRDLGFVQVDSVNTLARAHDLILWSRQGSYRPAALDRLQAAATVFEHWTHDAAVIPVEFWPHWRLRFARNAERLIPRWTKWQGEGFLDRFDAVLRRIADDGACTTADVAGEDEARGSSGWWDWRPSKAALEYLWLTGQLSIARREGFRKVYDLTERVIPAAHRDAAHDPAAAVDWFCNQALDRLGFATAGEIAAFWAHVTPAEAQGWCARELAEGRIAPAQVLGHDGAARRVFTRPGAADLAAALPAPGSRIRILSPFDPALRDRARAARLFGFDYRIEIFTPAAQRRYGYYVFPVLEGDRIIGRTDIARQGDRLAIRAFWPESGLRWGQGRAARLRAEYERIAVFGGCARLDFAPDWLRPAAP